MAKTPDFESGNRGSTPLASTLWGCGAMASTRDFESRNGGSTPPIPTVSFSKRGSPSTREDVRASRIAPRQRPRRHLYDDHNAFVCLCQYLLPMEAYDGEHNGALQAI